MGERQILENSDEQTQTNEEKFAGFTGLTATIHLGAHYHFKEAMEGSHLETVEVAVASVEIEDGQPVAFGVRRSELLRYIHEYGKADSPEAALIGMEPDRRFLYSIDGTETWPPVSRYFEPIEESKTFDPIGAPWL